VQSSGQNVSTNKPTSSVLHAGRLSCRSTNTVKALKRLSYLKLQQSDGKLHLVAAGYVLEVPLKGMVQKMKPQRSLEDLYGAGHYLE